MLIWPSLRRSGGSSSLDTLAATRLINTEDALLLDIREPGELASGVAEGAVLLPMDLVPHHLDALPRDRPITVYCAAGTLKAAVPVPPTVLIGKFGGSAPPGVWKLKVPSPPTEFFTMVILPIGGRSAAGVEVDALVVRAASRTTAR